MALADGLLILGMLRRQQHGRQHQPSRQDQWHPDVDPGLWPDPARADAAGGETGGEAGTERRGGHGIEAG
ncbi:MAG: hypothetical protein ER33_05845 [Cyanobium sp. CACIAM 14]|nr:MAG: hypothetical protein ER33_05845 [Cyanobium sp. CACIAM 14]